MTTVPTRPTRPTRRTMPATLAQLSGRPVVVGSGLAGLLTALDLAPYSPVLITATELGTDCASDWAQGGLAAAVGTDDDVRLHAQDTLAAGAGLCDEYVVRAVTAQAPAAVQRLIDLGAQLDRRSDGTLALGREGAHHRDRIVHAAGDGTGHELTRAALAAVHREADRGRITLLAHHRAVRLLTGPEGAIAGLVLHTPEGSGRLLTPHVVLATGGAGSLYRYTTNPRGARGGGLALGLRAGAAVRDLEFVQFHPTALDVDLDPMPLVSEAVRGHGARLIDERGGFVADDDLAARDVVARQVWAAIERGCRVHLDTPSLGPDMATLFPTVTAAARDAGIDPLRQPLPVRPAAHYHMGGLLVDRRGRTTVPGLWAVGEVASTGLHGGNRLASNSLVEAAVCSRWVATDVAAEVAAAGAVAPGGPTDRSDGADRADRADDDAAVQTALTPDPRARFILTEAAGVLRDHRGLTVAVHELREGALANDARLVSLVLAWSALHRTESRGGHTRTDHPDRRPARHTVTTLSGVLQALHESHDIRERSA